MSQDNSNKVSVVRFIWSRIASPTFIIGVLLAWSWHMHELQKIDAREKEMARQVANAKMQLSRINLALTECADGWKSGSVGSGTCSWHGGTDFEFKFRIEELKFYSAINPADSVKPDLKQHNIGFYSLLLLLFFYSRNFEATILGKNPSDIFDTKSGFISLFEA